MKIPRHTQGRTNIAMLESSRAALQTPGEAAAAASAGYFAVADIASTAGNAVSAYDQAKQATQRADDKLLLSRMELQSTIDDTNTEIAITEGNLTATEGEELFRENNKKRLDTLASLQHRDSIRNIPESLRLSNELRLAQQKQWLLEYGVKRSTAEFNGQWENAAQNNDVVTLSHLISIAEEIGVKNTEQLSKMATELDGLMLNEEVDRVASLIELEYLTNGMEAGEAAYDELVNNQIIDPETKRRALIKGQVHRANFIRSQIDEKSIENANYLRTKIVNNEAAKEGRFSEAANLLALENVEYGDPKTPAAIEKWGAVLATIMSSRRSSVAIIDVNNAVQNGEILEPSKMNRKALDGYVTQETEAIGIERNSDEYWRLIANTAQTIGVLPERERIGLNGGYVSKKAAEDYFQLYEYLEDNNLLKPDLGLGDKADIMYKSISSLTGTGMDLPYAIEVVWNARELNADDKEALKLDYAEEGSDFNSLINSEFYDIADPLFSIRFGPEIETKMEIHYDRAREAIYMATGGNIEAANTGAAKAIKEAWGPSNWGNSDADDYTIQENPLGRDLSTFQHEVISSINDMPVSFNVYTDGENKIVKWLDPALISFKEIPQQDGEGRDGVRRYQVQHNNRPVVNMDNGNIVDFPITDAQVRNISNISEMRSRRGNEVRRIQERIVELESAIDENAKVRSPYVDGPALKAELDGLKRELPNAKYRQDQIRYSMYPQYPKAQLPVKQ